MIFMYMVNANHCYEVFACMGRVNELKDKAATDTVRSIASE